MPWTRAAKLNRNLTISFLKLTWASAWISQVQVSSELEYHFFTCVPCVLVSADAGCRRQAWPYKECPVLPDNSEVGEGSRSRQKVRHVRTKHY